MILNVVAIDGWIGEWGEAGGTEGDAQWIDFAI